MSEVRLRRFSPVLCFIAFIAVALIIARCATPTQPDGGEPDRSGPQIVMTEPEDGTVNFDGDEIVFDFDKYVDRGSFEQAFSIQPEFGMDYEISWSRRTATVELESDLPDTTTVVFALSTDLTDMNNNAQPSAFRLAVSTGPEIDRGEITGFVIDGNDGFGMEDERVLLYRQPHDVERTADYIAQADEDGRVHFEYLREGSYKAFWVNDRNRNRRWDPPQEAAQPFPEETVTLESDGEADFGTIFIQQVDSIPPELIGVGMYNTQRLRLRFDSDLVLPDSAEISVTDEEGGEMHDARPLYMPPGSPNVVLARSEQPLDPEQQHRLDLRNIFDRDGNEAVYATDSFSGSDEADTTLQRLIGHDTEQGVREHEPLRFRYADYIEEEAITDSLEMVLTDTMVTWPHSEVQDNFLYVHPDSVWQAGESYSARVWNPGRMDWREYSPVIWHENDFGEIELMVEEPSSEDAVYRYRLDDEEGNRIRGGVFHDEVLLEELPPGNYTVRVFEDIDDNGRWDPGSVEPFRAPEPYFIEGDVPVESGMTGEIRVQFGEAPVQIEDETGRVGDGESG